MAPTKELTEDELLTEQAAEDVRRAEAAAGFMPNDGGDDDDNDDGGSDPDAKNTAAAGAIVVEETTLNSTGGGGYGRNGPSTLQQVERDALRQGEKQLAKRALRKEAEDLAKKEVEQVAEKSILRRVANWGVEKIGWEGGKRLLQRVGWRAAAEGAGETALEGAAVEGAEVAGTTVAAGAGIGLGAAVGIGVAGGVVVASPFAYMAYKSDKELHEQLNENSKAWRRELPGVSTQETLIDRYVGLTSALVRTLPQMQNKGQLDLHASSGNFATNVRLNDNILSDDKGHTLNLSDPKVLDEFQTIIDKKIAEQEKIRGANDSKYLKDWMRIFDQDSVQKKWDAEVALTPLYRARAELNQYREDISAHPPAPAASAPIVPAPVRPHGNNYSGLPAATAATYVAGDSIAKGMGSCCGGDVVMLAVQNSHITTQAGLTGATEQLNYVMDHYRAGDKLFLHTGWNDYGSVNSGAYKRNLEHLASQAQFLKEHGVEVVWVVPAITDKPGSKAAEEKVAEAKAQVEAMAKLQTEVAAAHGIQIKKQPTNFVSNDGIHPNGSDQYEAQTRSVTQGTGIQVGKGHYYAPSLTAVTDTQPHPSPGNSLIHERSVALADQLELHKLEQKYRLPAGLMLAIMDTECHGVPEIVNGERLSPRGACGAFQFMPGTAQQYGIDPKDPHQSADGAARMLSDLNKKYHGDVAKIAAAYNWGEGNLDKQGLENAPPETRNYIKWVQSKMGVGEPPTSTEIALAAHGSRRMANRNDPALRSAPAPIQVAQNASQPARHELDRHTVLLHDNAG